MREIYSAIYSQASVDRNITFVLVLHMNSRDAGDFHHLWTLPRTMLCVACLPMILRENEREIGISWERDLKHSNNLINKHWDLKSYCGYPACLKPPRDLFHLEKRVFIQVRESATEGSPGAPLEVTRRKLSQEGLLNYFRLYRRTFLVVRMQDTDKLLSSFTVRRSGKMIGKQVMKLIAEEFDLDDVGNVFKSEKISSNLSGTFRLDFGGYGFRDEQTHRRTEIELCGQVSTCTLS